MTKLIADSGSTQTTWNLTGAGILQSFHSIGLNPYFTSAGQMEKALTETFGNEAGLSSDNTVDEVCFYGSGCGAAAGRNQVEETLKRFFKNAEVFVSDDMTGAARGLCGRDAGIAVILGTGSNSCVYDGSELIARQVSLGYVLGDEGSGTQIGKLFLRDVLYGDVPENISGDFFNAYDLNRDEIVRRIYREPFANRFIASFTRFIHQHRDESYCARLLHHCFGEFIRKHILKYPQSQNWPVHFTGSVAFYFENELRKAAEETGIRVASVEQSPINGLVEYHSAK